MADGTIPNESVERLQEVGRWLEVNGESIYGASASPIPKPEWGRVTYKPREGLIYLHVLERPGDGSLSVAGHPGRVTSATLLGTDLDLAFSHKNDSTWIELPDADNDPLPKVIRLTLVEERGPAPLKEKTRGTNEQLHEQNVLHRCVAADVCGEMCRRGCGAVREDPARKERGSAFGRQSLGVPPSEDRGPDSPPSALDR
jgi:hypothetical protein